MDSFKAIIDAYSVAKLSEDLGIPKSHVRTMRERNSISSDFWPAMVEKAPGHLRGVITLDFLHELRTRRFSKRRQHAQRANVAEAAQ